MRFTLACVSGLAALCVTWTGSTTTANGAEAAFACREAGSPSWLPGGKVLAYRSSVGDLETYLMRASDGAYVGRLPYRPDQVPVWARDGTAAWNVFEGIGIRRAQGPTRRIRPKLPDDHFVAELPELAWSPDGQMLAFNTKYQKGSYADSESGGVFVVNRSGRQLRRLGDGETPTWSPDGRQLAVTPGTGITIIDVRTGKVLRGIRVDGISPAWSPRGGVIAFDQRDRIAIVRLIDRRVTVLTRPTKPGGWEGGAAWSPDGSRIAFTLSVDGGDCTQIGVMNADGSRLHIYGHRGP